MTAAEAEMGATEYMLGLEALGSGLGRKARQIFDRAQIRDIRPPLLKQQKILDRIVKLTEAGADPMKPEFMAADQKVVALDREIVGGWVRCLEQLQTLWLTEGQAADEIRREILGEDE